MSIRTLRYFVEVTRQRSFTHTAGKLFVTQSIISKMLRNPEDELNCTLLIRDGRRLLFTDTGRAIFGRGQAILGEFSQLESELNDIDHLYKGALRFGIPPMVEVLMAEPISRFRERYPGVELKIAELDDLMVQQAINNGKFDMAMAVLPIEEGSRLTTLPLFSHPLCVLTPRTTSWGGVTSLSPTELTAYSLVIYNEEFAPSRQLMRSFTKHDVRPCVAVRGGQWGSLAVMVQAGTGVAILPRPICQRLGPQNFCWIPLQNGLRWELGTIWREGVYMSHSTGAQLACNKAFWLE